MTNSSVHIPTLESARLVLRAPVAADYEPFIDFYGTDRAEYVGGPVTDIRRLSRSFGNIAGLWLLRGVSLFVAEEKSNPGTPIGAFGPYEPMNWPEMEFGRSIWAPEAEGKGYATEAMRVLIPWTWNHTGKSTAVSFIDALNDRSRHVAKALGAVFDAEMSEAVNAPGGAFHDVSTEHNPVTVWRHNRTNWEAEA